MFSTAKLREEVELRIAAAITDAKAEALLAETALKKTVAEVMANHADLKASFESLAQEFEAFKTNVFNSLAKDLADVKAAVAEIVSKVADLESSAADNAKKTVASAAKKAPKAAVAVAADVDTAAQAVEADTSKATDVVESVIAAGTGVLTK